MIVFFIAQLATISFKGKARLENCVSNEDERS